VCVCVCLCACVCECQHNNLTFAEWIAARSALSKHGLAVRVVRNVLVRAHITGGRYDAMRPLFAGPTALAYTPLQSPSDAADAPLAPPLQGLLDTVKKTPKLLVVGAKVESSLVAADELVRIVRLPGLAHLRTDLVATLQGPMALLVAVLQQTPQTLVANLNVLAQRGASGASSSSSSSSDSSPSVQP
jgi:large subunit ribosomal protein L10